MSDTRLGLADRAAQSRPDQATNSPCATCSQGCRAAWAEVQSESDAAVAASTPEERNRKISAAYAGMNLRRPDMQWIGLAAIVSRQAGCALNYAQTQSESWNPAVSIPASTAKQALAETNSLIFTDIYPVMRFYERYGAKKLEQCKGERPGGQGVPPQLSEAIALQEAGDAKGASDKIANYEQRDIVQTRIYNNQSYRRAFAANEAASQWAVGRYFGAKPAEIPLSSDCRGGGEVPMTGSISQAGDRVKYYEALMKRFNQNDPQWRSTVMTDILRQGQ